MTKKDYINFADCIKAVKNVPIQLIEAGFENTPDHARTVRDFLTDFIGMRLDNDSPKFDWYKWEAYIKQS